MSPTLSDRFKQSVVGKEVRKTAMVRRSLAALVLALLTGLWMQSALATVTYSVSFVDPGYQYKSYHKRIRAALLAAGALWAQHIVSNASLGIKVVFTTNVEGAAGRSLAVSYAGNSDGIDIYELGTITEARTGVDPNGTIADIELNINPYYLQNELWFDPSPMSRTALVPLDRTDAVSVFLHELGHAFGYLGWRDWSSGALPGPFGSSFDRYTTIDGVGNAYFTGPRSMLVYGAPIPLTSGSLYHLGNLYPLAGPDLALNLMNGVAMYRGQRYDLAPLNIAMIGDMGMPVTLGTLPVYAPN